MNWFKNFSHDLRYAFRLMRSNPMFSAVVIVTIALGIGANTAIFSVMNAVVLRTMPVKQPDRLVYARTSGIPNNSGNTGNFNTSFSYPVFERLRQESAVFDLVAWVPLALDRAAVRYRNTPEEAYANMVSGNFFSAIGAKTQCGRLLSMEDETNHAAVAVLSYPYWQRHFGNDCGAVGQTIFVRGVPFTIVGVTGPGFQGVDTGRITEIWLPFQDRPEITPWGMQNQSFYKQPNWWSMLMMARLADGVSEQQALARINPIFQQAAYANLGGRPQKDEKPPQFSFTSARGIAGLRDSMERPLNVLLAMVGLVLVIACGNVAMLLVARNATRRREFSIRLAVGGDRKRLFRQLLTEAVLLVGAGAITGWAFALFASEALGSWAQLDYSLAPDRNVLWFTLLISALVAFVFGLAPLGGVMRVGVADALRTSSAASSGSDRNRMIGRKIVVALQIALCTVVLVGAGLLVRTLRNLETTQLGFRSDGLLVFGINPQLRGTGQDTAIQFYETLTNRLRGLPGVQSVTLMQNRIGSGWSNNTGAVVDGKTPFSDRPNPMRWNAVGADYFATLGVPLVYGRDFTEADSATAPKVAIINAEFAKRYLGNQNPIGHTIALSTSPKAAQFSIVGVASNSKYTGVRETEWPMAYLPYKQVGGLGAMHIEVRTAGDPESLLPVVQKTVRDMAPDLPLMRPMTQRQQFANTYAQERLIGRLAAFFGALALVLVATGLYGTLSYMVARRTSELGLRMALGALREQVLWMILRESLIVCALGVLIGVPLAIGGAQVLRSMLYGVGPTDPVAFASGFGILVLVALIASGIPALRAASIDPIRALRYE